MKIGILTFQRAENYGAALQCKALYTYLLNCGNDVEIIDYKNESIESAYRIFPKFRKNVIILMNQYIRAMLLYKDLSGRKSKFLQVLDGYKRSTLMTRDEICRAAFDYDLIIVGSDQVWNPLITNGFDKIYFLAFEGNFQRAGYAISLGDINYPQFTDELFYDYASRFDYLSFREPDAADFVGKKLNRSLLQVVDPTLLLTKKQWDEIIENVHLDIPNEYVFIYYIIDGKSSMELIRIAEYLAERYNVPILYLQMGRRIASTFKRKVTTLINIGPYEFVYLIKNASYVVTSSFHGTALSCIYQKNISVMIPEEKGSRVKAIADMFHLEERVYSSYDDFCIRYSDDIPTIDNMTSEYQKVLDRSVRYLRQITSPPKN